MTTDSRETPPPAPAPRQTQSYLRNLFEERGLKPKSKLGQNFLIDLNLVDLVLRTADVTRDDVVLEVGSGTGSLTNRLAEQAGRVVSVEIDPDFYELAREAIHGHANVDLIHADILKGKNELDPEITALLRQASSAGGGHPLKLVANLPYAVATPLIANLLLSDLTLERMVVTVQWEIAERLMARPGVKDYSALSVLVQSLADVSLVRRLAPSVFWPRPQVASAIVLVRPSADRRAAVEARLGPVQRFRDFLRDLYTHRRKNLRGALIALPSGRLPREEIDRKLQDLGLDGTIRAETLDLEQHLRLCEAFG